ncbi:DUF2057 domain-containing protein [Vibrio europaeus]|uniref:DUF2057 domain-containing protein n=1 Tax=Vibrio europaeus TaxID=300876 RepID=A0AAE7ATV3_9VIBR|nr:DUF2057 family protein [Vibrio europaeus]MDC5810674.1 DUF2057 domain-containing protein [Vibrio europaeus]QJY35825.1 DUF2057 domain-containing protein [Vibrio europaeus]QPG37440.1 DUF2057 domain-containing protein [Vibrio europaeus]
MKKWMLTLFAFSSMSAGAATLIPEKGLSVLYVNGQQAESKIGKQQIPDGDVQLVIKMDKELGRGSSAKVFTSEPYVLSFKVTGDEIKINNPQARSVQEATRAFNNEQPKWVLRQDDVNLSYSQEKLPSKGGLLPYFAIDDLVSEYNQSKGIYFNNGQLIDKPVEAQAIAVAATTTAAVTSTSSKVEKTSPTKPAAISNVEQLKAWYLKSSKEERKAFRRWMIDQE